MTEPKTAEQINAEQTGRISEVAFTNPAPQSIHNCGGKCICYLRAVADTEAKWRDDLILAEGRAQVFRELLADERAKRAALESAICNELRDGILRKALAGSTPDPDRVTEPPEGD